MKTEPTLHRSETTPPINSGPEKAEPKISATPQAGRGVFGMVFLAAFILWNVAMIAWFVLAFVQIVETQTPDNEFEAIGATFGSVIALRLIGTTWAMGSTITGIPALLTRPR